MTYYTRIATALVTLALARAAFTPKHRARREREGATTHLSVDARCEHLFTNKSEAAVWPPPRRMPDELRDRYTMGGRAGVSTLYIQGKQNGAVQQWSTAAIHKFSSMCASQGNGSSPYPSDGRPLSVPGRSLRDARPWTHCCCCYHQPVCWEAMTSFKERIRAARAIVIGSLQPCAEMSPR